MKKKPKFLSFANRVKLAEWLKKNLKTIVENRETKIQTAMRASRKLGVEITHCHITGICREMEIPWPVKGYNPNGKSPGGWMKERFEKVENELEQLQTRIALLEEEHLQPKKETKLFGQTIGI